MYTNGLLRGRLFFGPSKRSSSLRETERDIIEKTRFTEAEERKKKRGRRSEEEEEEEEEDKELLRLLLRLLR
jgi:hypothetical protein